MSARQASLLEGPRYLEADRTTLSEYAADIWRVSPCPVE
jgi:hypothetical protein